MKSPGSFYSVTLLAMLVLGQQRAAPFSAFDIDKSHFPVIAVTGIGKISARPDIAEIVVGVVTQAGTAKEALDANNTAMDRLYSIFQERGVAKQDIRTTQLSISAVHSQPQPLSGAAAYGASPPGAVSLPPAPGFVPRIVGYKVVNLVQITSRQIDKLGPLLDAAVQGGANRIDGISFRVERADQLLDEARRRAIADAKRKAELLAGESGLVVGIPWKIEESAEPAYGGPIMFFADAPSQQPPSMPIGAGEQELSVTVSVVYELKNPK